MQISSHCVPIVSSFRALSIQNHSPIWTCFPQSTLFLQPLPPLKHRFHFESHPLYPNHFSFRQLLPFEHRSVFGPFPSTLNPLLPSITTSHLNAFDSFQALQSIRKASSLRAHSSSETLCSSNSISRRYFVFSTTVFLSRLTLQKQHRHSGRDCARL